MVLKPYILGESPHTHKEKNGFEKFTGIPIILSLAQ